MGTIVIFRIVLNIWNAQVLDFCVADIPNRREIFIISVNSIFRAYSACLHLSRILWLKWIIPDDQLSLFLLIV